MELAVKMILMLLGAPAGLALSRPSAILSGAALVTCPLLPAAVKSGRVELVLVIVALLLGLVSLGGGLASSFK